MGKLTLTTLNAINADCSLHSPCATTFGQTRELSARNQAEHTWELSKGFPFVSVLSIFFFKEVALPYIHLGSTACHNEEPGMGINMARSLQQIQNWACSLAAQFSLDCRSILWASAAAFAVITFCNWNMRQKITSSSLVHMLSCTKCA